MESESPEGRALPHVPVFAAGVGRRKVTPWPATASCPHLQPVKSCHHFKFSFSSNELLFKTTPSLPPPQPQPNSSFLTSMKEWLFLILRTCLWFTRACLSWIVTPLLFLKKLDFAGQNTYPSLLKRLTRILSGWHCLVLWAIPLGTYLETVNVFYLNPFQNKAHE